MKAIRKHIASKQSLSDSDVSQELDDSKITKPHVHRVLNMDPDFTRIVVNLAFTKYGVLHDVCKHFGWQTTEQKREGTWDLCWTDIPIQTDTLIRMHFHQKINYIPGMQELARKNLLGYKLNAMKRLQPGQYNFFPNTWMLPQMYSEFRRHALIHRKKGQIYIAKPENQCQGKGIFLTNRVQDIENGRHYVIQQYIANPLLIDHLKFDLRVYVLIASTQPLKIYIYEQGLARFATQKYNAPNRRNMDSNYTHLTNYAINKKNPNFVFNKSGEDMSVGHKRSLTAVFSIMSRMGIDVQGLKQRINDCILKTIIPVVPILSHKYRCSQPEDYTGNICFHVLGFDILIDDKLNPIVIQVNHTPSFASDTPLDKKIKFALIRDSLSLMNINLRTKQQLYAKSKQYNDQRIQSGKRQALNKAVREQQMNKAQAKRNQYEEINKGAYTLIFPSSNQKLSQKYVMLLQAAENLGDTRNLKNQPLISLDLFESKSKAQQTNIKSSHKPIIIHQNLSHSQHSVGSKQSNNVNPVNFHNYKIKPKNNFSVRKNQSEMWSSKSKRQTIEDVHRKKGTCMSMQKRNSLNVEILQPRNLFEEKDTETNKNKSKLSKALFLNCKKKRGNFIAPKVFDPSSCQFLQGKSNLRQMEFKLILK